MLARRHLLWLLAIVALVALGTKWGLTPAPAQLGPDIPIGGVAWTRVSLNMSGPWEAKMLVEFTKSSDIRPVVKFLEQRSSGWKVLSTVVGPEVTPTGNLLLSSAHGDLQIGLVLGDNHCAMWWWNDGQTWYRTLSAVERHQLLALFGMKWNQFQFEVVPR